MARYITTINWALMVAGPFQTYSQAQTEGIKYAQNNGLHENQIKVMRL